MLFRKLSRVLVVAGAGDGGDIGLFHARQPRQPTPPRERVEGREWVRRRRQGPARARTRSGARCRRRPAESWLREESWRRKAGESVGVPYPVEREDGAQIARLAAGSAGSTPIRRFPRSCGRQPMTSTGRGPCAPISRGVWPTVGAAGEDAAIAPGASGTGSRPLRSPSPRAAFHRDGRAWHPDHVLAQRWTTGRASPPEIARDEVVHGRIGWRHLSMEASISDVSFSFPLGFRRCSRARSTRAVRRRRRRTLKAASSCATACFRNSLKRSALHRHARRSRVPRLVRSSGISRTCPPMVEAAQPGAGPAGLTVGDWMANHRSRMSRMRTRSPPSTGRGSADRRLFRAGAAQRTTPGLARTYWLDLTRAATVLGTLRSQHRRPGRRPVAATRSLRRDGPRSRWADSSRKGGGPLDPRRVDGAISSASDSSRCACCHLILRRQPSLAPGSWVRASTHWRQAARRCRTLQPGEHDSFERAR